MNRSKWNSACAPPAETSTGFWHASNPIATSRAPSFAGIAAASTSTRRKSLLTHDAHRGDVARFLSAENAAAVSRLAARRRLPSGRERCARRRRLVRRVQVPDGTLFVSIGDVAGHGIEASITVRGVCGGRSTLHLGRESAIPSVILKQVDRILSFQEPETMATAIVGRLDPAHKTLTYAIAGHPPPMLARQKHRLA